MSIIIPKCINIECKSRPTFMFVKINKVSTSVEIAFACDNHIFKHVQPAQNVFKIRVK